MKKKLYTYSHNLELLKKIGANSDRFTSEEHAYVVEEEFSDTVFRTRNSLIRNYSDDFLDPKLSFVANFIKENDFKNILSLGSGPCVNEYFLKKALPENRKVIACDFDAFFIKKAKEFFSDESNCDKSRLGIIPVKFDFFSDSIEDLKKQLQLNFDVAIFFSSAYVMNDKEFICLFKELKNVFEIIL